MDRKKIFLLAIVLMIFSATAFSVQEYMRRYSVVQADEDEEDEEDEDDEDDEDEDYEIEYVTQTVIVTPSRTVNEEKTEEITLVDSDRDGLADKDDPHPEVAEIYVVSDDDKDGIDDGYEKFFEQIRIDEY